MNPIFEKRIMATDLDELCKLNKVVINTIKMKRDIKNREKSIAFNKGDDVWFILKGVQADGVIVRINQKTATVKLDHRVSYRVPYSMLNQKK